ncbi:MULTISPECIES: STAS domain-containing protein [unclassified Duganella]|jgi:rsbT co-antagonist protein RsbR|uniref:STAS domain-containing protein n=1 Tax=unclassified Duganella TaxID=2636909 RepID=UPI000884D5BA|nr:MULTISPECIES: STAS domain-containing protein [unclassified Duganella]SDG40556.1 rsbT co-antagonist protein RsbR [Duganella sp. OV458]SDJ63380.1 rsbT co-antagonist protein RsbR [Duganella sp. OV510]
MSTNETAQRVSALIKQFESEILTSWTGELAAKTFRNDDTTQRHCRQFLALLPAALPGGGEDINSRHWDDVRNQLNEISAQRAKAGSTPNETATFVFSLKQSLFTILRRELVNEPLPLADALWAISTVLDQLGLYTVEVFQKSRDQIIVRQQHELMELSTPVVKLWQDVLALPLIGTLDSARSQVVMESLLEKIVETGAAIAIIDITGVPTVDTLVAQHLMKTIAAARLMGADCIISGIRPQIAQTIVHLGVNLEDVVTKATLADAFVLALSRVGATISRG